MQYETFQSLVKPLERVGRTIWLAFLAAVVMYVGCAYALRSQIPGGVGPALSHTLTIYSVILSLVAAVLAPYLPRLLFPDSRLRQIIDQPPETTARNPRTGIVDEDRLTRIRTLSPDEQRLLALVPACFVPFVVRLAFNESIALYGLLLALLSKSFAVILPFAIASFALNLMVPSPLNSALDRAASFGLQPSHISTQPR
jgi:hypothetical protein